MRMTPMMHRLSNHLSFSLLVLYLLSYPSYIEGLSSQSPSSSTSSSTPRSSFSTNQQSLADDAARFPRTWVPLASTFELDPDRPTPLSFLGQRYVTYRDNSCRWVVLDDCCPHRLSPLSEGRIDRNNNNNFNNANGVLECSYHGWAFDETGQCRRIPQIEAPEKAMANPRCHVTSYPVVVEKDLVWAWLWPEDPLSIVDKLWAHPEHMMSGVLPNSQTYTRDLPYSWDTLLENIVDPSHVPFAHHSLQGTRDDATPISMTKRIQIQESGLEFEFEDRTMGKRRKGNAVFRAPFVIQYNATFEQDAGPFNLTVVMTPTKPGWSRAVIYAGGPTQTEDETKGNQRKSLLGQIFSLLPVWLLHQFSNRFLDSDLALLHYQEQERQRRRLAGANEYGYFMPAPADRCITACRKWIDTYAPDALDDGQATISPPAIAIDDRDVLFDRWTQHSDQCRHCNAAVQGIQTWRRRTYGVLGITLLLFQFEVARIAAVGCLAVLGALSALEPSFKVGGFDHYKNH